MKKYIKPELVLDNIKIDDIILLSQGGVKEAQDFDEGFDFDFGDFSK